MAEEVLKKYMFKKGISSRCVLISNNASLVFPCEKMIQMSGGPQAARIYTEKTCYGFNNAKKFGTVYLSCAFDPITIIKDNTHYYPKTTAIPQSEYKVAACGIVYNTKVDYVYSSSSSYQIKYEWVQYWDCNEGYVEYKRPVYTDCYENECVYEWVTTTQFEGYRFVPNASSYISFSLSFGCISSYWGSTISGRFNNTAIEIKSLALVYRGTPYAIMNTNTEKRIESDLVGNKYAMSSFTTPVIHTYSTGNVGSFYFTYAKPFNGNIYSTLVNNAKIRYGEYYTDSCADSNGSSRSDRSMQMTESNGGYFLLDFYMCEYVNGSWSRSSKTLKIPYYIYSSTPSSGTQDYNIKSSTYRL